MNKILIFTMLLVLLPNSGGAVETPLSLTIQAHQTSYGAGEDIELTVQLENKSDREQIIFWSKGSPAGSFGPGGAFVLETADSGPVETIYIPSKTIDRKEVWINLGNFVGKARLTLQYNAPKAELNFKTTARQALWWGTLISNTIEVAVDVYEPASAASSRAMHIAEVFLAGLPFKDDYEPRALRVGEDGGYVEVFFLRKKKFVDPSEGLIRVNKNTGEAQWIPLE